MEVVIERACDMDIHKDNITACILTSKGKEIQTFSTKTVFLLQLIDWIKRHECTHVAMESTGVFWKPIVNLLEAEGIEFLVVNAQHMKALPGRKTDVKDSEWIAKLLHHGLLKASFIPDRNQRELRELVRYRRSIIEERARQHNRIQKVLEGANIKLGSVVSDIMGVSSRDMLRAIAEGEDDPEKLASFARRTMKRKKDELELALQGYVNPHQRLMIKTILTHIATFAYQGFELLLVVFPYCLGKGLGKLKVVFLANGFVTFFYTYLTMVVLTYFGPSAMEFIPEPILYIMKFKYFKIIDRVDLLFFSIWIVSVQTRL